MDHGTKEKSHDRRNVNNIVLCLVTAIIGQDMLHSESLLLIEGQHSLIEKMQRAFRELRSEKW